jgi:hypothetical protein
MKRTMMVGAAALLVAGTANAALITGASQRYVAGDFNGTTWTDTGSQGADATASGTFNATTVNGLSIVENSTFGSVMDFTRTAALGSTTGQATIQAVIRIDGNHSDPSSRSGPIGIAQANGWSGLYMGANIDGANAIRGGNVGNTGTKNDALNTSFNGATIEAGTWGVYTLVVDASQNTGPQLTVTFADISDLETDIWSHTYSSVNNNTATTLGLGLNGALFSGEYNQGPAEGWLGAIADIVIYDSALSTADLATNAAEFNTLYGAIPEPATLGLIAAFGGGLLFVRRRFSM